MKYLIVLSLFFSTSSYAKIYDAFMCYTTIDTVVLFGVLKTQGTMRINYHRLEQNPTTINLKIKNYNRSGSQIQATGEYGGKEIVKINSANGFGSADIDLTSFAGTEDVSFNNEDLICYFGKFED
ncbi:MAG: hypothetical protein K9K67_10175 [Bacteriovoracaceae bacterium]|nr:hypothetical protein [Bacteriovoracaceae bacterium]